MHSLRFLALLGALLTISAAAAEIDAEAAQDYIREAGAAYRDGDMQSFTDALETAYELNPFSLATRYNLACAYALGGRAEASLALLESLVAQRIDYGMANDDDLASLRDLPRFGEMVAQLESSTVPVVAGSLRHEIERLDLVPEGIAIDTATGRTFVGSMRTGEIFVFDATGGLTKFATVEHDGPLAAIGLTADVARGTLWAVGASFGLVESFDPDAPPRSGVFGFDLESGEPTKRYLAANPVNGFNDVTLGPDGTLYLSGDAPSVVRPGSDHIQALPTTVDVYGSNGVALHPDGRRLYTSAYPVGIAVIDLHSGDTRWLEAPDDVTLYGIDGLYWYRGGLVGVQNGTRPWRLARFTLDDSGHRITSARYLEFANPAITPTTGAIVGDDIHYVGQGPRPDAIPAHVPAALAPFLGKTLVMTASLE